jgi:hypothetical protein
MAIELHLLCFECVTRPSRVLALCARVLRDVTMLAGIIALTIRWPRGSCDASRRPSGFDIVGAEFSPRRISWAASPATRGTPSAVAPRRCRLTESADNVAVMSACKLVSPTGGQLVNRTFRLCWRPIQTDVVNAWTLFVIMTLSICRRRGSYWW